MSEKEAKIAVLCTNLVSWLLDQIFFCNPVVLESICYRTRAKRLKNGSNTTAALRKIWTGVSTYQISGAFSPRWCGVPCGRWGPGPRRGSAGSWATPQAGGRCRGLAEGGISGKWPLVSCCLKRRRKKEKGVIIIVTSWVTVFMTGYDWNRKFKRQFSDIRLKFVCICIYCTCQNFQKLKLKLGFLKQWPNGVSAYLWSKRSRVLFPWDMQIRDFYPLLLLP